MKKVKAAFLAFQVSIYSYNIKDQLQYPRKIYIIDNGLRNAVTFRFAEDRGRLLENLVFCQLHRQRDYEIYYWANKNGLEVDFVVKRGTEITDLIQGCESLSDTRTKQREMRALLKAMDEFGLNTGTILTYDEFSTEKIDDKHINIKPTWLWLLES